MIDVTWSDILAPFLLLQRKQKCFTVFDRMPSLLAVLKWPMSETNENRLGGAGGCDISDFVTILTVKAEIGYLI